MAFEEMCMQPIRRAMDNLGFCESTIGTRYIREAIQIASGILRPMMCKDIYPEIAKRYGTSPANIERSIRKAIEVAKRSPHWEIGWTQIGGWQHTTYEEIILRLLRVVQDAD